MSKWEETEWLGQQGDDFDRRQREYKEKFLWILKDEYGISEEMFNGFSCESKVHYMEIIDVNKR